MLFLSNYHSVEDLPSLVDSRLDPYSNQKRSIKTVPAKLMSALSIYVQMLSAPVVVPHFICCIACVTYFSVGTII